MSRDPLRQLGRWCEVAAAIISVGAGIYLLTTHSVAISIGGQSGTSWFQVIAHGLGWYFVARGLWMFGNLGMQRSSNEGIEQLVELHGGWEADHPAVGDR